MPYKLHLIAAVIVAFYIRSANLVKIGEMMKHLQLFQHLDDGADIAGVFGIADVAEPAEIVASLIAVLDFRIVSADALGPVAELVVGLGAWISQTEEIVLVAADGRAEPACLQYCLCQYYLRMPDAVALYLREEIGNGQLRQICHGVGLIPVGFTPII